MVLLRQNTVYADIQIEASAVFLSAELLWFIVYEEHSLTQFVYGLKEAGTAK